MKNAILITPFFLFVLSCRNDPPEEKLTYGDSTFVWASSLNIYEEPSEDAETIGQVLYGSEVMIADDSIGRVAYRYKAIESKTFERRSAVEPFYLDGFWVKISYNGIVGYVFDGYLSKLKPLPESEGIRYPDNIKMWAENVLKLKSSEYKRGDNEWVNYKDKAQKTTIRVGHDEQMAFTEIKLKNVTLQEGIMLALQLYKTVDFYLVNIEGGVYHFTAGNSHLLISLEGNVVKILLASSC